MWINCDVSRQLIAFLLLIQVAIKMSKLVETNEKAKNNVLVRNK
jgi:hypothetical protein